MDIHTFKGKRKIGTTDISDFTDFQGIGRDPLYKRFASVAHLIDKVIAPEYAHFLAVPDFDAESGEIKWYVDIWNETPERLKDLPPEKRRVYESIKNDTISYYRSSLDRLSGEDLKIMASALRYINEDFIYCADGKVFAVAWGMTPDNARHETMGELVHEAPNPIKINLTYLACGKGSFAGGADQCVVAVPQGCVINEDDIPAVNPDDGFEFSGFYPNPLGQTAMAPMEFKATYRTATPAVEPPTPPKMPGMAKVRFDAGPDGTLEGQAVISKSLGAMLAPEEIPVVIPAKGYKFVGWNFDPLKSVISTDTTFTAMYSRKTRPWWWWLLWSLLVALIVLGILALCGVFNRCGHDVVGGIRPVDELIAHGDTIDDNGFVKPIEIRDGKLPDKKQITAPVYEEGGILPGIIREPGLPPVIADRLVLFIEDDSGNIDALADGFKKAYPGDNYAVIGFDRYVKSVTIKVPDAEREQIRAEINSKIPNVNFIVFDESVYEIKESAPNSSSAPHGWHLDAVKAPAGWQITKGSPSVTVAVVDDGIDRSHAMFSDRIVNPYNVFLQDNRLSKGVGHGTMVAGLAVGSLSNQGQGAAGIAPDCSLMPVQVSDNGYVTLTAMVSGIMYAVHQGADVINVSIGPQLQGLNVLPIQDQMEISQTQFLNVAKLWKKVCDAAAAKNAILVFAAGNDDILSSIPPENRAQNCVVVGAVDERLYPSSFTNYGFCTDISAPGTDIYSSFPVNGFNTMDGTSFSAPMVSGAIGLMRSLNRQINVEQVKNVLYRTGRDVYGFMPPMLQVAAALESVKNNDFSRGPDRAFIPVPVEGFPADGNSPFESWVVPSNGAVVPGGRLIDGGEPAQGIIVPVDEEVIGTPNPVNGSPGNAYPIGDGDSPEAGRNPSGMDSPDRNTDYSLIRDKIRRLKNEIKELERQLPENHR